LRSKGRASRLRRTGFAGDAHRYISCFAQAHNHPGKIGEKR